VTVTRQLLYRPLWIAVFFIGAWLIIALAVLAGTSWRSIRRLKPIHAHLGHVNDIQQTSLDLQGLLLGAESGDRRSVQRRLDHARATVGSLMKKKAYLTDGAVDDLRQVHRRLAAIGSNLKRELPGVLQELRRVNAAETRAKDRLLDELEGDTHAELALSTAVVFTLPLVGLMVVFLLRRRIFQPLRGLGNLMTLLARQDFRTVPTETVDPLLRPLFSSYNHLVARLTTLEAEHRALQRSLERQVRDATQSLLAQQRTLARAERLAATGEVAASLAHELRNPLAGLQMALSNLRGELDEPDQAHRLELMIAEVKRVIQLLNGLLGQSLVAPEPATEIRLRPTVEDLLTLVRYQIPETIKLESQIPPELSCRLPRNGLHQALLNLLLNAAQALGDDPGHVRVGAELVGERGPRQEGGRLRLSVSDDGPGFPTELLRSGARPFVTWRDEGTGLGLAMVRRFAQDLGGELGLENLDGGGACVTVELPCKEQDV
jgi:signal transduction histidine kinase